VYPWISLASSFSMPRPLISKPVSPLPGKWSCSRCSGPAPSTSMWDRIFSASRLLCNPLHFVLPLGIWLCLVGGASAQDVNRNAPGRGLNADAAANAMTAAVSDVVQCAVPDRQDFQRPDRLHLNGWIGERMEASEQNRLMKLDPARLLEGFRKRPGRQAWDGEYVGKWMDAATLAWVYSGDPALRKRLDYVAAELAKCQLGDGYLGTYLEKDRWTNWDVWVHEYDLIGLITYMRYTGNREPLPVCRAIGDLLCRTFGDAPGKRDIIAAGEHVGMAPTSVLEPMVLLYRLTGDRRYLDFCNYILRAWEQPNGPHIISRLRDHRGVNEVGDGKAYEMLSCLDGALELYRTTGDSLLLQIALNAWQDIVSKRLYVTGTASFNERFQGVFELPNAGNVAETCVTVTWMQFNAQLLRLTGEARFAEQLEKTVLNQLLSAQRPSGSGWGYFVPMECRKSYNDSLDNITCCASSGPRGLALIPTFAVTTDGDGAVVNLYEEGTARLVLHDGTALTLVTATQYPLDGRISITLNPSKERVFAVKLRIPAWCGDPSVEVNSRPQAVRRGVDGYAAIRRTWAPKDRIQVNLHLKPRVIVGHQTNEGKVAVLYGPLVLAADDGLDSDRSQTVFTIAVPGSGLSALAFTPVASTNKLKTLSDTVAFRIKAIALRSTDITRAAQSVEALLVPIADAGCDGTCYRIWLPLSGLSLKDCGHEGLKSPTCCP